MNFCTLLNLPPNFLFQILLKKGWKRKYGRDKDKTQKTKKLSFGPFLNLFWETKMGTLNLIRAFMYLDKSLLVKGQERETTKKRDRDKERARYGPKRHANYALSSPVSIPSFGEPAVRLNCAKMAQLKSAYERGFRRRLELCMAPQGGHIVL